MAELSSEGRAQVWRGMMRYLSKTREPIAIIKSDLQSAVIATDVWIDNNAASYNAALPAAAQAGLTATQKTLLFVAVALARSSADLLRRVFGRVD